MDHDQLIESWFDNGEMTPDAVLQVMASQFIVDTQYTIFGEATSVLKQNFGAIVATDSGGLHLSEGAFVASLKGTGAASFSNLEGKRVLYRSIYYLSRFPFEAGTSKPVTFDALLRGLAWMNPETARSMTIDSTFTRSRTPSDYRRMLFQSLATLIDCESPSFDEEHARREAQRRAFEFSDEGRPFSSMIVPSVNYDDDGDELFHDMLDVLCSTHPRRDSPPLAPPHRDEFRPLAKRFHNGDIKLCHLRIDKERFRAFVKLSLAYGWACDDTEEWDSSADNITNAFDQRPGSGIDWLCFDQAFKAIAPYLFNPIICLLSENFIRATPVTELKTYDAFKSAGSILTPAILSQLATVLSETISLEDMQLVKQSQPQKTPSSTKEFLDIPNTDIEEDSEGFVIVISGHSKLDDMSYTFGCYTPQPWNDIISIQKREYDNWENCSLFQISPVHSFFRGKIGKSGWVATENGDVQFGQANQGVGIELKDSLRSARLTHRVTSGSAESTFEPQYWRGDFVVEIDVQTIEIWRN